MLLRVRRAGTREADSWLGIRSQPDAIGSLIGLEHEFRVLRGAEPVDFRELIHTLPIDGLRLDPGDRNAYRCRSGLSITADGAEAEFATPPIAVRPGFAHELSRWAERGRAEIERSLPPGVVLEGFSTHLSITMDDAINERVCNLFAETFSAGLALLVEGPQSQGIYVRPRPGRIELCGEFVRGERLEAAAAFAVGAVLACWQAVVRHAGPLPPRLRVNTLPGIERYGIRVRREAYGVDLYAAGRRAALELAEGGGMPAQDHFEAEWRSARSALDMRGSRRERALVSGFVSGRRRLAIEGGGSQVDVPGEPRRAPVDAFGAAVRVLERPGYTVTPRALTWEMAVLRIEGARTVYAAIPRKALAAFEDRLAKGSSTRCCSGHSRGRPRERCCSPGTRWSSRHSSTRSETRSGVVAPERGPAGSTDDEARRPDCSRGRNVRAAAGGRAAARRRRVAGRRFRRTGAPGTGNGGRSGRCPTRRPTRCHRRPRRPDDVGGRRSRRDHRRHSNGGSNRCIRGCEIDDRWRPDADERADGGRGHWYRRVRANSASATSSAAAADHRAERAAAQPQRSRPRRRPWRRHPLLPRLRSRRTLFPATATQTPPATAAPRQRKRRRPPKRLSQRHSHPTPRHGHADAYSNTDATLVIIAPPPPPPPTASPTKAPSPVPTAACTPTAVNPCP